MEDLEHSATPEWGKFIARKLAATLKPRTRPSPASVPLNTTNLALGDAQPEIAEVGWLQPTANRVPASDPITSPLLDSGKLYATGLYAHAPSRYVFNLGGKWKELTGEAGLHTQHQPRGSVAFIIKADGQEVFHSAVIRRARKASYKIDLTGVKKLGLIVDPTPDGKHNDWGLWLDPVLRR